jgi:hypothetical protein
MFAQPLKEEDPNKNVVRLRMRLSEQSAFTRGALKLYEDNSSRDWVVGALRFTKIIVGRKGAKLHGNTREKDYCNGNIAGVREERFV